jgi:hypothetical protein
MPNQEIPLSGGNVNTGVVRVGDTVRRTQSSMRARQSIVCCCIWKRRGFAGSPRFLGIDAKGSRDSGLSLKVRPGIPVENWQRDEPLIAAAQMLRQYHDATVDFERQDS